MPRRTVDTSKLEELAKNFYQRSQTSTSTDSIKNAAIKGIQASPITVEEIIALANESGSVSAKEFFGRSQSLTDVGR